MSPYCIVIGSLESCLLLEFGAVVDFNSVLIWTVNGNRFSTIRDFNANRFI